MKEEGIWQQIEEILVKQEKRNEILELLHKFYKRRPERFRKYKEVGHIPKEDIVQLLGEYSEVVLEELKTRGGPTRAPIEFTKAAEECLRIVIELYGSGPEGKRRREPLYPHVSKRQGPKFPHGIG